MRHISAAAPYQGLALRRYRSGLRPWLRGLLLTKTTVQIGTIWTVGEEAKQPAAGAASPARSPSLDT